MSTEIHWIGSMAGEIGAGRTSSRGDWLEDEIADWKRGGISSVLSLLTPEEERDLDLSKEASLAKKRGLKFTSLPIPDRQVPQSEADLARVLDKMNASLISGRNILVHCRRGVGRTGLVAACLLVKAEMSPGAAVETVSAARGLAVPETGEQRDWIERYAPAFTK